MNLILFEPHEVTEDFLVTLPSSDRRYIHCTTVLKLNDGGESVCRAGVIGGDMFDAQVILLTLDSLSMKFIKKRALKKDSDLNVSLILAMPRPKVLDRLWPVFAQLGFRRVMLINAERVENAYFHTHVLQEDNFRPKLIKGLEQAAASTRLPEISVDKRTFDVFLSKRLDVAFPPDKTNRFICHPEDSLLDGTERVPQSFDLSKETVIAFGPEGGWLEPEIDEMKNLGFIPVTCSSRIFTTDVALVALTAAIVSRLNPSLLGPSLGN